MDVTVEQAAVVLNVSSETVRRRVRSGALPSQHGGDGRLLVTLPDPDHNAHTEETIEHTVDHNAHSDHNPLSALVDEKDRRIAELTATVEDLRRQAEAAAVDRHELLMIIQRQQFTIEALTPRLGPGSAGPGTLDSSYSYETKTTPGRRWWRWW